MTLKYFSGEKNVDLIRFETEILFRIDKENVVTAANIVRVWMWARARAQGLGYIFVHWIGLAAEQRNALNKITSNQSIAMVHSYTWGRNFSTDQCTQSNQSLAGLWAAALLLPFVISSIGIESENKCHVLNRVEANVHQTGMEIYRKPFTLMAFPSSKVKQQHRTSQKRMKQYFGLVWFGFAFKNFSGARSGNSVNGSQEHWIESNRRTKAQLKEKFTLQCNQYSIIKFVTYFPVAYL